jgi:CheY-like chemotaxis protein
MTNEAISAILDHFYNEARSSAQGSLAVKEILRNVPMDATQRLLTATGTASADQLLRSIDDVRDLLCHALASPSMAEEFDFACVVHEIVEVLNMASGNRGNQMAVEASPSGFPMVQNRRAVEQMLTRILDTALKLDEAGTEPVRLSITGSEAYMRLAITMSEASLAVRLAGWLNANPERALLQGEGDIPFGLALMVAGKRLRALGGAADVIRDWTGHTAIALDLSPRADGVGREELSRRTLPDALNILVAEDSDESFALSELVFQEERVWRARDGQEALQMIQKQRFDVVLMDVHMPGIDGYEVIRRMRSWETETGNARTPMVILSSDDLETQHRSAAELGCSGFLRKPLRRRDLMPLLERLK